MFAHTKFVEKCQDSKSAEKKCRELKHFFDSKINPATGVRLVPRILPIFDSKIDPATRVQGLMIFTTGLKKTGVFEGGPF